MEACTEVVALVKARLRGPKTPDWRLVLTGWLIGLVALVMLLLSVTGLGTGPGGFSPLRSILFVWVLILVFAGAWSLLLRGLPWPSPLRRSPENTPTPPRKGK